MDPQQLLLLEESELLLPGLDLRQSDSRPACEREHAQQQAVCMLHIVQDGRAPLLVRQPLHGELLREAHQPVVRLSHRDGDEVGEGDGSHGPVGGRRALERGLPRPFAARGRPGAVPQQHTFGGWSPALLGALRTASEWRSNKLTASEYDETTWSARTFMAFAAQRISVAVQLSMAQEVAEALGLSVAADPRAT